MKASEARQIAKSSSYANYVIADITRSIRAEALKGYYVYHAVFQGPTAISPEAFQKVVQHYESHGYTVKANLANTWLTIGWSE